VLVAVKQDKGALGSADASLQEDEDVVQAAEAN